MNRVLIAVVAASVLAGPLAAPAFAQGRQQQQDRRGEQSRQETRAAPRTLNREDEAVRSDRRDLYERQKTWKDGRSGASFDESLHNGYTMNNRWYSGPPPASRAGRSDVRLGYKPWARGQRLGYYSNRYAEVDYRQQNLRQPPRGYHWVRDDDGDYLLAAVVGGLIAQVIMQSSR